MFLILKNIENKSLDKLLLTSHIIIDCIVDTGVEENDEDIVHLFTSIDSLIKHPKVTVNLATSSDLESGNFKIKFGDKYDSIYFNHHRYDGSFNYTKTTNFLLKNNSLKKQKSKILANSVMIGGEGATDFLMFVRRDDRFETKFLIGHLESTPKDKMLLDGIERVILK